MTADETTVRAADDRARLQLLVIVLLATGAAYVIARLLWPFLTAIVTSAVVATLVWPLHLRVLRAVRLPSLAALASTLAVFVLVMLPLAAITAALLDELQTQVPQATASAGELLSSEGRITTWIIEVGARFGASPAEISRGVAAQVQAVGGFVLGRTVSILSGLGGWLLQAGAALFTLYYLLKDGDRLMRRVRWIVPLEAAQTDRLLRLAADAIHATMLGNVVVAIVQGLLGGIAFWIVGLPGAVFWGLVMGVLSLLPVVGPVFVWVPGAIILFATGRVLDGVILTAIGVLLISAIDNVLRSILISGRAELHPLAVFFSILGGIILFGAVGVLLGPVLIVLAFTVLEMGRLALLPDGSDEEAAADLLPTAAPGPHRRATDAGR
jgi:predicted PurR-regulated permease PerM